MVTASSESSSRTPSATVAVSSSSRISSRTASSTSVRAAKSKSRAEKLDQAGAVLGLEGFEQVAQLGFVEVLDELLQALGVRGLDGIGGGGQEFRIELAFLVPEGRGAGFGPSGVGSGVLSSTSCMSRPLKVGCRPFRWRMPVQRNAPKRLCRGIRLSADSCQLRARRSKCRSCGQKWPTKKAP